MNLPIFDRNQGEVARTRYAVTQAEQLANENSQQVLTDVVDAYAGLHQSAQIVDFYRGGYMNQAKLSRDISEYAYRQGRSQFARLSRCGTDLPRQPAGVPAGACRLHDRVRTVASGGRNQGGSVIPTLLGPGEQLDTAALATLWVGRIGLFAGRGGDHDGVGVDLGDAKVAAEVDQVEGAEVAGDLDQIHVAGGADQDSDVVDVGAGEVQPEVGEGAAGLGGVGRAKALPLTRCFQPAAR